MKLVQGALVLSALIGGSAMAAVDADTAQVDRAVACSATVNPVGYPQYAGTYVFYINNLFAQSATLAFTPTYPQYAGTYFKNFDMDCYTLAGMPSIANCTEKSNDVYKYTASFTGNASFGVQGPGISINLGAMICG